jgi:hypothetical protein
MRLLLRRTLVLQTFSKLVTSYCISKGYFGYPQKAQFSFSSQRVRRNVSLIDIL